MKYGVEFPVAPNHGVVDHNVTVQSKRDRGAKKKAIVEIAGSPVDGRHKGILNHRMYDGAVILDAQDADLIP